MRIASCQHEAFLQGAFTCDTKQCGNSWPHLFLAFQPRKITLPAALRKGLEECEHAQPHAQCGFCFYLSKLDVVHYDAQRLMRKMYLVCA